MNGRVLVRATFVGVVLQLALFSIGHFSPWVRVHAYEFTTMMISATAAYLYAMDSRRSFFTSATGGAIVGGLCGFAGLFYCLAIGDVPPFGVALGTAIDVFTGAVGGLFGQIAARWRAWEMRRR
ncbi:MAG: hypothetical protein HY243_19010 [Proteobacteria bacterium]|nr:hypothetical protein [Pseudomonadota bacterium]